MNEHVRGDSLRMALASVLPFIVITNDDDGPYLLRLYLLRIWRRFLPGWFIHYFYRSDSDREMHNHPWRWALSLVLSGGYRDAAGRRAYASSRHSEMIQRLTEMVNRHGEP